jgi:ABC-type phosphate transport system substrate-binding protein
MKRAFLVMFCLSFVALSLGAQGKAAGPEAATQPGFVIVINAENKTAALPKNLIVKLFLKKVREWDSGAGPVTAYDLDDKSEARKRFTTAVHGKSISAIKSYWQRMIFSGREVPPDEIASEQKVLEKVAADKGAIGYVSLGTPLPAGVKELKVAD